MPVALSTDMPFGDGDPWAAMRAAVTRQTRSGVVLGADERVTPAEALAMFLGRSNKPAVPRSVARGELGDLCVLALPPVGVLAELDSSLVRATVVGGERIDRIRPCENDR